MPEMRITNKDNTCRLIYVNTLWITLAGGATYNTHNFLCMGCHWGNLTIYKDKVGPPPHLSTQTDWTIVYRDQDIDIFTEPVMGSFITIVGGGISEMFGPFRIRMPYMRWQFVNQDAVNASTFWMYYQLYDYESI